MSRSWRGTPGPEGPAYRVRISSRTSLPTKTFAFASTVVRSELTIACDATNTASASDAATRNRVASLEDDARRRTVRYQAETRDASPLRRRISATAKTRAATMATPSANSNGNRNTADAGRSIVVPVTPPPASRRRDITYAPASARISHGRNITTRASPARGSCFDAKAIAVTVPIERDHGDRRDERADHAEDRADGSTIPRGPSHAIMAVATRKPGDRADDGRERRLERRFDAHPPRPPAADREHPRVDAPGAEREHAGRPRRRRTRSPGPRRTAHGSVPRTAASRWSTMPTTPVMVPSSSVVEPCPWKKNSRPQHGKIFRSCRSEVMRSLRSLRDHGQITCLVERDRLVDDGCRQRESRARRAELRRERDQLVAIDQDRLGWRRAIGALDMSCSLQVRQ